MRWRNFPTRQGSQKKLPGFLSLINDKFTRAQQEPKKYDTIFGIKFLEIVGNRSVRYVAEVRNSVGKYENDWKTMFALDSQTYRYLRRTTQAGVFTAQSKIKLNLPRLGKN